jgi:hypothetical protein
MMSPKSIQLYSGMEEHPIDAPDDQFARFAECAGWPPLDETTIAGTFTLPDDSPLWRLPHAMAANKGNN